MDYSQQSLILRIVLLLLLKLLLLLLLALLQVLHQLLGSTHRRGRGVRSGLIAGAEAGAVLWSRFRVGRSRLL